ncbi:hypothetical protein D9M71_459040 [compost metagenome]
MFEVDEGRGRLGSEVGPFGVVRRRAAEIGARTVAVEQRKSAAHAIGLVFLVLDAGGQTRARCQLAADHAVQGT